MSASDLSSRTEPVDESAVVVKPATQSLSIGVSIVLYRTRVREIEELVHQLLEQGARRIYIVDNSPAEFGAFAGWSPPDGVILIRAGANLGYGGGHNIAIRPSVLEHDYHLVCNPDITLSPGVLPTLTDLLSSRPQVGLCMPRVIGPDGRMHYACKRSPVLLDFLATAFVGTRRGARRRADFEMRGRDYSSEMEVECLSGCFMFFRSGVLRELDGFDDRYFLYFEDFDLSHRVSRLAETLYYPGTHVVHQHARAHSRSLRLRLIFIRSALQYFNRWGWFSPHSPSD